MQHTSLSPSRIFVALVSIWFGLFGPAASASEAIKKTWDYPPFGATDIALFQAFQQSCTKFTKWPADRQLHKNPMFGTAGQWAEICREAQSRGPEGAQSYLNERLTRVALNHKPGGRDENTAYSIKFTGYFKPVLEGSRTRQGPYQTPILAKPTDLVVCNGKSGQKLPDGRCQTPYRTRAEIETNLQDYKVLEWLKDPDSAFFLQVQGSGTVELEEGGVMHLGFAAKNGHPYVAIGKILRNEGKIKAPVTADKIRDYLEANPQETQRVTHSNPSFIFFRETTEESPGAMGVKLTGGRSLAVDRDYIPLGVPLFVATTNTYDGTPWERMMFAQDVGSAIQGPVRGDIYFGQGPLAGKRAGRQNATGKLWALVPRENVAAPIATPTEASPTVVSVTTP